jgi:trk system potassium uptake protein
VKGRRVIGGIGVLLMLYAVAFVIPAIVAAFYDGPSGVVQTRVVPFIGGLEWIVPDTMFLFLLVALGVFVLGATMFFIGVVDEQLRHREAYAIVGLGWFLMAAIGTAPYLLLGTFKSPVDALFESTSGITTTGATILSTPFMDHAPSILVWRAVQQWIGGLGIVVVIVAVIARLTQGGQQLLGAETPHLGVERVKPRLVATMNAFWVIYLAYSVVTLGALTFLMHFTGVKLPMREAFFDALVHTFTSVSTGGFSNREESIAFYGSYAVEAYLSFVMVAMALSFVLHYLFWTAVSPKAWLRGRLLPVKIGTWRRLSSHTETRLFFVFIMLFSALILGSLWYRGDATSQRELWLGFVQTVSIVTTTGYTPVVFDDYNESARFLFFLLFFIGGCAGSTSGGFKVVRTLILGRLLFAQLRRLLHPRAFLQVRLGRRPIAEDMVRTVAVFSFAYLGVFLLATLVYTALGLDMVSAMGGALSGLGNIGPALGAVHGDFLAMPWQGRLVHVFLMIAGRLELFTLLILLYPSTWRR